jgi:hypothetical protein
MPTTIVAGNTLAEGQVLNPVFDSPIFLGMPVWIFINIFLVLILIVVNLIWMFRMKRLASVRGYVDVMKKATQEDVMVWVLSTTRNLTIECLRKRDTILEFYNKLRVSKWYHDSPISVIHAGGKGAMVVTENYYRTRDMVSEIALCYALDHFNANQDAYQKQHPDKVIPLIKDYDDYVNFGREQLETRYPYGLETPAYNIFDPQKFSKYFPKGLTAMFYGAGVTRWARKKKVTAKQQGLLEKYLGIGILVGLGIIAIVAAWMFPLRG